VIQSSRSSHGWWIDRVLNSDDGDDVSKTGREFCDEESMPIANLQREE
jgi:hypothetical protein